MHKNRLFLIDAYALIFRLYYGYTKYPKFNSKNLNIATILGFINFLIKLIKKEKPTHLGICFDSQDKTFRHKEFKFYKSKRNKTPQIIKDSIPYIKNILNSMNIYNINNTHYEADDLIGTLTKKAEKHNFQIFIVTYDKDFAQLVSEKVFIYKPLSKYPHIEILGIKEIKIKFDISHPIQIIDLLGIMGDSADNIPGFPGIGEKTAKILLKKFNSLENILKNINKLNVKLQKNIENHKEIGLLSKKLATINTKVPIQFELKKLIFQTPNWEQLNNLCEELELNLYHKINSIYLSILNI